MGEEKEIITELIELYKGQPCLWNYNCAQYKDNNKKRLAWEVLVNKWKTIDPIANEASVKKKIDNLKASYKRELKKVKDSKRRTGSAENEVHKPNLWYYDLMTFLNYKKETQQRETDTLSSDDEPLGKRRRTSFLANKHKHKESAQDLLDQNKKITNSFAVYVGEQLDLLATNQRQIAEKLISDVLFLGKTEHLNFNSKIETPTPQFITPSPEYASSNSQYIKPSPQYNISSPQYNTPSPQYNIHSPQHDTPTPKYASLGRLSHQIIPSSSPIQDQPTVQSIQYSSLSQQLIKPDVLESSSSLENQPIQLNSDPLSSQYQTQTNEAPTIIIQPTEGISQNFIGDPAGMLLKELLISKTQQK